MSSVVICAYTLDRWEAINSAVESVARQTVDDDIVVVIDHNDELLERCARQFPHLTVVPNRFARGLSGARNTGVGAAAGEIIAFLDDDATAADGWLTALVAGFGDPRVAGVGGTVLPAWEGPVPAWLPPEFWWVVGCSYVGQPEGVAEIRNPIGANMAFRRSVFAEIGGFREEIGRKGTLPMGCEETELGIRARAAGYTITSAPDAIVHHLVGTSRTTVGYFLRRCLSEGRSKALVSAMAGREAGLAAERTYVRRTLPAGVRRGLASVRRGPHRSAGLGAVGAIVAGVGAASIGLLSGEVSARRHRSQPVPPPLLTLEPSRVS